MAGRKYSFTEQRKEEIKFATVPLGSLVWTSSYLWPRLVNISKSLLLFKHYQQFLKGESTNQSIYFSKTLLQTEFLFLK